MCGIAGIINQDNKPVEKNQLVSMASYMQERGPDHTGYHINQGFGFTHTRLSIIDLNNLANQPFVKDDVSLVFNGEIYNYLGLRKELQKEGCVFRTNSDTEVLLEGYRVWGINKLLLKCNGMFAFAISDKTISKFYLCRDRFGQKPLYYANIDSNIYFASDIRSIATLFKGQLNIDMESVDYFLTELSVPQPKTIWREIQQVKSGHLLEIEGNKIKEKLYWNMDFNEKQSLDLEEYIAETKSKLEKAVMRRTVSDLPIGCFLSGGVDSGLVTSILAQNSSERIKTFSVGMDYEELNELPDARIVANKYQTDHYELMVNVHAQDDLIDLVEYFGEPFADSSMIPSYLITKEIKKHVTVALSGDGGDEFFGGYWDYLHCWEAEAFYNKYSNGIDRKFNVLASKLMNKLKLSDRNLGSLVDYYKVPNHLKLNRNMGLSPYDKSNLYGKDLEKFNGFAEYHYNNTWTASYSNGLADKLMESSLNTRLLNDYLVKVDRSSMKNSLEVRSPFLDHELAEWSFQIPGEAKFYNNQSKYILKKIAQEYVDPNIFDRKKRGFGIPMNKWLRKDLKPLVNDTLLSQQFRERGWFNNKGIQELIQAQNSGSDFLTNRLFAILCLELWLSKNI
jgi:asparagine synthase (glutamine-hydrolysing)